jgi:uncharacterized membrane protein HdeD (DUF308 family)
MAVAVQALVPVDLALVAVAVPAAGAFALVWLVSLYAIFTGVLLLALAWRERRWVEHHPAPAAS